MLLIVPYGIEIGERPCEGRTQWILLIVPYGIEICFLGSNPQTVIHF